MTRNRKLWKKAHSRRQVKKYKSRYKSAVRTRSKARAKLGTAQANVRGACPAG